LALDYYKQAIAADPKYAPAYMEAAEIYHLAGRPTDALEYIKKYLEIHCPSVSARKRYASFQFLNKQYVEAIMEIEDITKKDPNDCYMWRILGYAYYEMGNGTDKDAYTKGTDAMEKFFKCTEEKSKAGQAFKFNPDDYKYYGMLLGKQGKDSLGADAIMRAIALDSVKNCELYGEIGKIFMKSKNYAKAIMAYEKKMNCTKGLGVQDWFDLGRAYFFMGGGKLKEAADTKDLKIKKQKDEEARPWFVKADTAFSRLIQASPNFPTGWYWRGKTNVQLDPKSDQWLAKPYFEKYLSLIKPEERALPANKENVIISCEYLGYYYVKMKDYTKAKEYWNIVQTIDPNNEKAKAFFKSPEAK
jgi:tetratricopeptide (TPR) repeat protein